MNPEDTVSPRAVKRALLAAKIIKFSGVPSAVILVGVVVASFSVSVGFGVLSVVIYLLFLMLAGSALSKRARCPRCRVFWHCRPTCRSVGSQVAQDLLRPDMDSSVDETEDFRCRKCGLEIGPYVR